MRKVFRFLCVIIGICLIISGCYNIVMVFWGNDIQNDDNAKQEAVYIGENIADENGVEFCVNSVEDTSVISSEFSDITTDNNYIVVNLTVANNSNEPYEINALDFTLLNGETEHQSSDDLEIIAAYPNYLYLDTINPGLKSTYIIVYETASSYLNGDFRLRIYDNYLLDDVGIYIMLKNKQA